MTPAIFGMSATALTRDETGFFKDADPAGYILFGRNIETPDQVRALTDELRSLHGRDDLAILIDQEGGRVARLKSPTWPEFPTGETFDRLYDIAPATAIEAARINALALADVLHALGITVDCLPLLDVRQPGADDIIGDRALGSDPMRVAALGRAIIDGLRGGGVVGVVKHIPGHGRALCDSHKALPRVSASDAELASDLAPFIALNEAPMAMTAHIVYEAWDAEHPATQSRIVIDDIIRGRIGFDGLLMSDDLDMEALSGTVPERASRAIAAGCDLALNCWAKMDDMVGIADALPAITHAAKARLDGAMARIAGPRDERPYAELAAQRDALIAAAAA
ncbi:beta-N-acetylhexosaminidase [Sphingorhabdus soli]|uniref:beta-N-acetylhexosaminidase n=1 Tax=Flavisphingopyxis soli TaxID=2601267 RepID=A0A5C6U7D6_9SPHN|nr:beta-N-acetylhexosaminidase [Sphingorhabdus soli]TXC68714.1 beta-N-acetylhexosaminidase [Sphingorhabdus soli]